jgi:hypothetical protein
MEEDWRELIHGDNYKKKNAPRQGNGQNALDISL